MTNRFPAGTEVKDPFGVKNFMFQDWPAPPGTLIRSQPPKTGLRAGLSTSRLKIGVVDVFEKEMGCVAPLKLTFCVEGKLLTPTVPVTATEPVTGTLAFMMVEFTLGVLTTLTRTLGVGGGAGNTLRRVPFAPTNSVVTKTRTIATITKPMAHEISFLSLMFLSLLDARYIAEEGPRGPGRRIGSESGD
jgi:hypothetical protein